MPEPTTPSGTTGTENVGAPAAPASTPSTSSTPPSPTTTTGAPAPTTALGALQKASAAASSTAQPSPDGNLGQASAGAKVQPESQPGQAGATDDPQWMGIPEQRRNTILQNARKAEREEVLRAVRDRVGWAVGVDREQAMGAFGLAQRIATNPVQFVVDLIGEIRQTNPQSGAMLEAALNGSRPQAPWAMPEGALRAEDGTRAFSEKQVVEILDQYKSQILDEVRGELGPMGQFMEQSQERELVVNTIHEARTETAQLMAEMRQLPHFTPDNEPKIGKIFESISPEVKQRLGAVASLQMAYQIFLRDQVFPTIERTAEERIRARDREKAAAGIGGVPPQTPAPQNQPRRPRTPEELSAHMAKLAQQASA